MGLFEFPKAGNRLQRRATIYAVLFLLIILSIYEFNHLKYQYLVEYENATETLLRILGDRDPASSILPNQETTLFQPTNLCKINNKLQDMPYFLYMVVSAPQNYDLRNFVRRILFENTTNTNEKSVKVLFFIGIPDDNSLERLIFKEAQEYGDVIIENFRESYLNLTLKSMRMLKWYNTNCAKSRYLIKADDDMHINPQLFFEELSQFTKDQSPSDDLIAGHPLSGNWPRRDPESKWFIPYSIWPESTFPEYASSGLYVLSRSTAFKIYNTSIQNQIPLFPYEDIYINGIIGNRMLDIKPQRIIGFVHWKEFRKLYSCDIARISLTFISSATIKTKLRVLNCLSFLIRFPKTCSSSEQIEYYCGHSYYNIDNSEVL